jgi:hypothetical protein
VGATVTVDSPSFPDRVHFENTNGGGGVNERRVFKQLESPLPLDGWTLEFDYIYSLSQLVANYPVVLTETSSHVELHNALDYVILYHGAGVNNLRLATSGGDQAIGAGIDIAPNTIHYVRLERTSTNLELGIFSDPARTTHISGSPVSLNVAASDFDNLNYIQHSNSRQSGPARVLTGDVDNTVISGMGSGGTLVEIGAGAYSVSEDTIAGYAASYSTDCSGTIAAEESKTCIITNDDTAVPLQVVFDENFDSGLSGWSQSLCIRNDPDRQTCEIGQATELLNAPPNNLSPNSLPNWGYVQVNDIAHPSPAGSPEVRYQKTFNVIEEDDYDISAWLGTKDCGGCNVFTRLYIDGTLIFEEIGVGPSLAGREGEPRTFFREAVVHLSSGTHNIEMAMFSTVANAGEFRASFDDIKIEH